MVVWWSSVDVVKKSSGVNSVADFPGPSWTTIPCENIAWNLAVEKISISSSWVGVGWVVKASGVNSSTDFPGPL